MFENTWKYMKSVFCNILQIWILYTYMYYIHICMNSKYKRRKKEKYKC
jgi:hypothetical protein